MGDRVFGFALTGAGTYSWTTLLLAEATARTPRGCPTRGRRPSRSSGTTALDALDQLALPAGSVLLINGVGDGVGLAAAQLARDRGLTVFGTGSSGKRELATAAGVTFLDYTADAASRLRAVAPDGFDGVLDMSEANRCAPWRPSR